MKDGCALKQTDGVPYDMRDAKRRNERASTSLLHAHLVACGVALGEPRQGDPAKVEPDAVCDSPAGVRGLEATNLFYDAGFARWTWETAIEADGGPAPVRSLGAPVVVRGVKIGELSPLLVNPNERLANAAEELLAKKCGKAYSVPTYVVLDARTAGIITSDDGPAIVARLRLAADCPLLGAYLCLAENMTGAPRFFEISRS